MSDCCNYFVFTDPSDSFASWEGLRGPKGDPGEPGPKGDPGTGLTISGTVASVDDLPETAAQGTVYNVGASEPYELYMYETGTGWISLGYLEGPAGPQGPAGPAGADGAPGTPGAAATIAVGSVSGLPAGSTPTVTNSGSSSAAVFNFGIPAGATGATGPEGPEGPPGKGLTISGTVASTSQLPATAEQGTVYNVGASEPYELYMYETGTGWISLGYLEGPPGQDGDDGTTFTPSVSAEGVISWTNDGGKQNPPSVNIKGPQGATGPAGQDGSDGAPGADGVSPEVTIGTITGGHSVTITDADHPTGQTFNVMDGEDGAPGTPGTPGTAAGFGTPTATIGSGTGTPSVQISASGPDTAKVFAFAFDNLKGAKGDTGETGGTGPQGPAGPGVPTGGSAGQVLTKTSGTDYATGWATPEAGGGAIYKQNVAILATSGTIASVSDSNITADFVVVSIVFANPSAITSDVTWTTGAGSLTLTGTCSSATTADIILVKT